MDLTGLFAPDSTMGYVELFSHMNDMVWKEMGAIKSRLWSPTWTESKLVEVRQGLVRGRRYAFKKGNVDAFLGIPFGQPPVGELRFKKPLPAESWQGVRDCTEFGPRCPHDEMLVERYPSVTEKSEDCLRLNVFAPDWDPNISGQPNGFAVMVFVHGGGFAIQSAAHYGDHGICESLCLKDVIVVTIQYRLGFFGFSAGPGVCSNAGLWDQTLALKWVNQNISAFGGDPNNVTVFGQSAGGACADFLCLSPHSRSLFQKVIPMAGTAMCSFALNSKEYVEGFCRQFAIEKGYKPTPPLSPKQSAGLNQIETNHIDFLRRLPAYQLEVGLIGKTHNKVNTNGKLDLTPVFDGDFFPKPIEELRLEAPTKVVLTGITESEGLLFVGLRPPRTSLKVEVNKLIERELIKLKVHKIDDVKKKLVDIYMQGYDSENKKDMTKVAVRMVSDIYINNGAWRYADAMANLGHTVYQYCFEYYNSSGFGLIGFVLPFKAATHGTELPYIFKKGVISNFHPNDDDLRMLELMTKYFTNFAKWGNPNGLPSEPQHWKPLHAGETLKYMSINLDKLRMCDNLNDGRSVVWKVLLEKDEEEGAAFRSDDRGKL